MRGVLKTIIGRSVFENNHREMVFENHVREKGFENHISSESDVEKMILMKILPIMIV